MNKSFFSLVILSSLCCALFAETPVKVPTPQIIRLSEIAEVNDANCAVQDTVVAVRAEIFKAKRGVNGSAVLLVAPDEIAPERKFLFDTLTHFSDGRTIQYLSESELPARLNQLGNAPLPPATTVPVSRMGEEFWSHRAAEKQLLIASNPLKKFDIVLFGDSITHNFERGDAWGVYAEHGGFGINVLTNRFANYTVLDIGYGADRVQHLLWRGQNGELDGYKAKLVVLMIGTNNARTDKPQEVADGIAKLLALIREKQPSAKIILHPIFPRGQKADDNLRKKNNEVNALIKDFADGKTVFWVDFNAKLVNEDGSISQDMMPDYLHPCPKGYAIWADELMPYVRKFCGKGSRAKFEKKSAKTPAKVTLATLTSFATNIASRVTDAKEGAEYRIQLAADNFSECRSVIDSLYVARTAAWMLKEKFPWTVFSLAPLEEMKGKSGSTEAFNADLPKLIGAPPSVIPVAPWLHDGRVNYLSDNRRAVKGLTNGVDIVFFSDGPCGGFRQKGAGAFAVTNILSAYSTISLTSAETINQVLWNALSGDFDGYAAKYVVLSVNPGHEVHETKAFPVVPKLVEIVKAKQPQAKIILTPACPGGVDNDDEMRKRNARFSAEVAKLADGKTVFYCDYSAPFFMPDGTLNKDLLAREFVPTAEGYNVWAKALLPFLR